jgi:hypothetical protein
MPQIKGKSISSVQDYIDFIDKENLISEKSNIKVDFLFRGQQRDEPLIPKLGRLNLKDNNIKRLEDLILKEFERKSSPLCEIEPKNKWDLIAIAQHFGLPTRLLDWTYSALLGLWFTVEKPPYKNEGGKFENGVVWILIPQQRDFEIDFEEDNPLSNSLTKIFRPNFISRRISAQDGLFTIHKIVKINKIYKFIPLENNRRFQNKLIKIIVPFNRFSSIRTQLHISGINYSTVFPDMEGLCRHLSWRFSYLEDEGKGDIINKDITNLSVIDKEIIKAMYKGDKIKYRGITGLETETGYKREEILQSLDNLKSKNYVRLTITNKNQKRWYLSDLGKNIFNKDILADSGFNK